jgi:hypothetical protein
VTFGKIIDWIGRNLSRIKTIGVLVLLVFFILSLVRNGCDRTSLEDMVEKVTGLNVRNDILMEDVKERDSLLIAKDHRIIELQDSLGASDMRVGDLEYDYDALEAEYDHLSDSLLTIPVDTSYEFLVDEAYPYPGHLRYPFNEPQVKGIHLTFLENIQLDEMNLNLLTQIDERDYQLDVKDTVVYEQAEAMMLMAESRESLDSIIINKDEVIEIQDEQIDKVKKSRTFWQIATGVILGLLAALAIGGG